MSYQRMRFVRQGDFYQVKLGRNVLGKIVRDDSGKKILWRILGDKTATIYETRRAASYRLWAEHMFPTAFSHLSRLKGAYIDRYVGLTPKSATMRIIADMGGDNLIGVDDKGLYESLKKFAKSMRWNVREDPLKGSAAARIYYKERLIRITPSLSVASKARALAHELAHAYMRALNRDLKDFPEEVVVEAVACAILWDHGIDCHKTSVGYIRYHMERPRRFLEGKIDQHFVIVYEHFRRDLKGWREGELARA